MSGRRDESTRAPGRFDVVGRLIRCVGPCRGWVDVLDAAQGARSDEEHRYVVDSTFVCDGCLGGDVVEIVVDDDVTQTESAMLRARLAAEASRRVPARPGRSAGLEGDDAALASFEPVGEHSAPEEVDA